jgi:hypothetical protein
MSDPPVSAPDDELAPECTPEQPPTASSTVTAVSGQPIRARPYTRRGVLAGARMVL